MQQRIQGGSYGSQDPPDNGGGFRRANITVKDNVLGGLGLVVYRGMLLQSRFKKT